jgi:hypothetical protein
MLGDDAAGGADGEPGAGVVVVIGEHRVPDLMPRLIVTNFRVERLTCRAARSTEFRSKTGMPVRAGHHQGLRGFHASDLQDLLTLHAPSGDLLPSPPLSQRIPYGRQLRMCPQNCFRDFVGHQYLPVFRIVRTSWIISRISSAVIPHL